MRIIATAVVEQIEDIRNVMTRIVRTSSEAADRRDDQRIQIDAPAILIVDGTEMRATCRNISRGGARIDSSLDLQANASVILRLPGLPDLPAEVLQGGRETGLSFKWEAAAAPPELKAWLGQKAAA